MDVRATFELEELRAQDAELAAAAERLRSVEQAIRTVGSRAAEIADEVEAQPRLEGELTFVIREAEFALERRRKALEAAEQALGLPRDDETWARLERVAVRAAERADAARKRHERAVAALEELEGDAAELPAELARLESEARALAASIPGHPEPGAGAEGLVEWASHAHAELFVAVGELDRRREDAIREANELASMLLGEPTYGSTVAQAVARVEQSR